nr:PEP-CTERM sorting domain-containing protein [Marinobacter sp. DSM 26671]
MKNIFLCLSLVFFASSVNAGLINDFTGGYDVSNWNQSLNGGAIDTTGAPSSILQISSNSGGGASDTDFTISALGDGLVTFDWLYKTYDSWGSSYDPFGWLLNGSFTQLTQNGSYSTQSGTATFAVTTGDVFGFRARATDSIFGSAVTKISNFSAPVNVPEPASLALLGLGLAGLGFARRKNAS